MSTNPSLACKLKQKRSHHCFTACSLLALCSSAYEQPGICFTTPTMAGLYALVCTVKDPSQRSPESTSKFTPTKLLAPGRPDGSVGMALVLPALTDCRWWFESLLIHSGVSSATRRKATGADHKKTKLLAPELNLRV